jgi:hypothetical protein
MVGNEPKVGDDQEPKQKDELLYHNYIDYTWKNIVACSTVDAILPLAGLPAGTTGKKISSNLPNIQVTIKNSDSIFELSDNSLLILEFQSTKEPHSSIRFLEYGVALAKITEAQYGFFKPIQIVVLYPANIYPLPNVSYSLRGTVEISFKQISLKDLIDGKKLINTLKKRLKTPNLMPDDIFSSPSELMELYLAPFGRLTDPYEEFVSEYLAIGVTLSKILEDPSIFGNMLVTIPESELRTPFQEEFKQMNQVDFLDYLSGGQFSKAKEELAILDAKLEAKDATIEAKDATIEAQRKNLKATVLNLSAKNFTIQEISVTMGLSEKEVTDILWLSKTTQNDPPAKSDPPAKTNRRRTRVSKKVQP